MYFVAGLLIAFVCGFYFSRWAATNEARKSAVSEFFYRHKRSEDRYKLIFRARAFRDGEPIIALQELSPLSNGARVHVPESVFKSEFEEYDPADPTGPALPPMWLIQSPIDLE